MSTFKKKFKNITNVVKNNEEKIVISCALILIGIISFQIGLINGQKMPLEPILIEKGCATAESNQNPDMDNLESSQEDSNKESVSKGESTSNPCIYVGSKNSNKFYLATCSWAKRIKPENLICFKTAEDATGQGRTESKCD